MAEIKTRPIIFSAPMVRALLDGRKTQTRRLESSPLRLIVPSDLLYVRETFAIVPAASYWMSDGVVQTVCPSEADRAAIYLAGWERSIPKWRPSLHMPRWASRLTLDVTEMRLQSLQDISDEDAIAEGVQRSEGGMWCGGPHRVHQFPRQWNTPRDAYADLWDALHGVGAWKKNPKVVPITFAVHKVNVDQFAKAAA